MGRTYESVEITFSLSDHNSQDDVDDREAMEDFKAAVGALLASPVYADLALEISDCTGSYQAMNSDRRTRVGYLLRKALHRVDKDGM